MQGRTKVQISGGAIVNGPQKFGGPGRGPVLNFGKTGGAAATPATPVRTGLILIREHS